MAIERVTAQQTAPIHKEADLETESGVFLLQNQIMQSLGGITSEQISESKAR